MFNQRPKVQVTPEMQKRFEQWKGKVGREITPLSDRLNTYTERNRVELEEFYFRAFVDFFAGDENLMYFGKGAEAREVAIRTWNNVAGNPLTEVDVIAYENGEKKVLFTVPAFYDRNMVEPVETERGKSSIYGAVINANNIVGHSPQHAEHYLEQHLGERLERMWRPQAMLRNAEAWNKIFAFYGRPPLVPSIAGQEASKGNGDISQDEVVGFDPL